jgi:GntR family transcriptional regulator
MAGKCRNVGTLCSGQTSGRGKLVTIAPSERMDRSSAEPLWSQLQRDLLRRLEHGEFEGWFPGEMFLVGEYKVSRNTVREALRRLRDDGMVVAERGRRPRVAVLPEIEQSVGALYSLFASVEDSGLEQRSVIRARDIRQDPEVAVYLSQATDEPLFYLERLRLAGGTPLALDRVWMPAVIGRPLLKVDFSHTALYEELAKHVGISLSGGRELIRAIVPDKADRETLAMSSRHAAFVIERLGYWNGRPVEWRYTLLRADRFSLVTEFSQGNGYRFAADRPNRVGNAKSVGVDGALTSRRS